jgi:hypothetical protein
MGPSEAGSQPPQASRHRPSDGEPGRHSQGPAPVGNHFPSVRYRGFVLIPQADLTWLIRPERSPMRILPFRVPASSLTDVKALVDWRLTQHEGS